MIRTVCSRLERLARDLHRLLYTIARPFMPIEAITAYEVGLATRLANQGEQEKAIAIVDRLIDSVPDNPMLDTLRAHLYTLRAHCFTLQMRHDKAMADLNMAISLDASIYENYVARGRIWAILGEHERAIDDFTLSIEMDPQVEAYEARGNAFLEIGKHVAAMDDYETVISLRPDSFAYVARGTAFFHLRLFDSALTDFNTATHLDPASVLPYVMRGQVHQRRGNHQEAVESFTKAIGLIAESESHTNLEFMNPDMRSYAFGLAVQDVGKVYCGRGLSRSSMGDITGSLSDFSAAIQIMPQNASFYLTRALAYAGRNEWAEAMRDLDVASELDGQMADVPLMKAEIHIEGGELNNALRECQRSVGLGPNWAPPYLTRGKSTCVLATTWPQSMIWTRRSVFERETRGQDTRWQDMNRV